MTTVFSESGVDLFLNVRIIGAEDCYRGGPLGRIGLCVGHLSGHEKGHKSNKSCHCVGRLLTRGVVVNSGKNKKFTIIETWMNAVIPDRKVKCRISRIDWDLPVLQIQTFSFAF